MEHHEKSQSTGITCDLRFVIVITMALAFAVPSALAQRSKQSAQAAGPVPASPTTPSPAQQSTAPVAQSTPAAPVVNVAPPAVTLNVPPAAVNVNIPPYPPLPAKPLKQLLYEAFPNMLAGALGALLAAIFAIFVGLRLTAGWDIRKKRAELDIQLTQQFNSVVGDFKAIAREWEILRQRLRRAENADGLENDRYELLQRAVRAESILEAILLKLVSETASWLAAQDMSSRTQLITEKRQLLTMALFRIAFRNLREAVAEEPGTPPGFGDPELWLFNRLAAEMAGIVYQRATSPDLPPLWAPWRITTSLAKPDPTAYLTVIAYRTFDLRMAEAAIRPDLVSLEAQRLAARMRARRKNVAAALANAEVTTPNQPTVQAGITAIVEIFERGTEDDGVIRDRAEECLARLPGVLHYLGIVDGPPRVLVMRRGEDLRRFPELEPLPADLSYRAPYSATNRPLAVRLLAWTHSDEMLRTIRAVATRPLSP